MADQIPCQAGNVLWKGLKKQVVRGVTQEMTNHSINSLEDETSLGCEKNSALFWDTGIEPKSVLSAILIGSQSNG